MRWKLFIILFLVWFQGYSQTRFNPYIPQSPFGIISNSQTVYVCTGSYSYAYHSRSNCSGLNNCKGEIKYTNEEYAISGLKRKPCCICWSNVQRDCYTDNSKYSSSSGTSGGSGGLSDNSNAQAAAGLAILVGSVAVLSNDFYLHYTNNFDASNREIQPASLRFGFRKLFGESVIEYGATLNSPITKSVFIGNYSNGSYQYPFKEVTKSNIWNYNLGFLHRVYSFGRYQYFNLYLGPTANYTENFGLGGIISTQYTLGKVGKLDLRYEITSQTHHFSIGFIIHYQDKYFWQ